MQPLKRDPQIRDIVVYIDPNDGIRCPAIITFVHTTETVNVSYVNANGTGSSAMSASRGGDRGNWDYVTYG